jgi:cytochrome c peroxidase
MKSLKLMLTAMILASVATGIVIADERPPKKQQDKQLWDDGAVGKHTDIVQFEGVMGKRRLDRLIARGRNLFSAVFTTSDGVGRPMATQAIIPTKRRRAPKNAFARTAGLDANACSSCHNQPTMGGAGDFVSNVFVSEGFQLADFDSTDPQFSNERNTNHLFGAGLVELLAREMSQDLAQLRKAGLKQARSSGETISVKLTSKGVDFGQLEVHPDGVVDTRKIEGIDTDLIIKPFSQKGVMTSLRQFTINALNHHHGMQATERFGARWTGTDDFDEDGVTGEVAAGDVSALVLWQATLKPPTVQSDLPDSWTNAAARGSQLFDQLSCNACHQRNLPLESLLFDDPGPLDAAGTLRSNEMGATLNASYNLALMDWAETLEKDAQGRWLVPLFGDLKRHVIADSQVDTLGNELLSQRFVERNVFMTGELWGVGSTAPYGHRGDLTTLNEVIIAHGGDARDSRDAWRDLDENAKSDINAFLKTLVIEP